MKNIGNYYVGLDIGSDSVGWAVTDMKYNLIKFNQKSLWGIRLFNEAVSAVDRRTHRTDRRRLQRRRQRINWLMQLFAAEIERVDPTFFLRLSESKFSEDDKSESLVGRFSLFCSTSFTDIDYFKKYPTIYHLRKALLSENDPFDVRLVYLAIHHIIKKRGHFLFNNVDANDVITFEKAFEELCVYLREEYELELTVCNVEDYKRTLKDRMLGIKEKEKKLRILANAASRDSERVLIAINKLLAGASVSLCDIFDDDTLKDCEVNKFSFKDDVDAILPQAEAALGDRVELIKLIKAIYDWAMLEDILQGNQYLSFAKVECYKKHKEDLKLLKALIREKLPHKYSEVFRKSQNGLNNYSAYSGHGVKNYCCNYDQFKAYLNKLLKGIEGEDVAQILAKLDNSSFLPLQVVKNNSVIPSQINRRELVEILKRASDYLPFLSRPDENGMTVSDKILSIFDYRVPYYVGPLYLNDNCEFKNHWVVRSNERIYPWNFDSIVDRDKSAEIFIERMTSSCTYIAQPVLPKDSLLYSEFMVLNELNNLCINGRRISADIKSELFENLFKDDKRGKNVTLKKIKNHLISCGVMNEDDLLSGIDINFKASLTSYFSFRKMLSSGILTTIDAEDIIKHIVLYGADQKLLKNWLFKNYGGRFSDEDRNKEINYLTRLRFSGWGRLSREFLTEIYHIEETGEAVSIIEMLRRESLNLMELLSGKYGFAHAIEKYKTEHNTMVITSARKYIEESYASPPVKRAITQAIAIVDEIVKITGHAPAKIFVEMARDNAKRKAQNKGNRKFERKIALLELYKKCKLEADPLFEMLEAEDNSKLRGDKLYLYYTQKGRCMYSGEAIDIGRLESDYDIDHIYPQCRVKDDSLDNRVLVKRTLNGEKGDSYPISDNIRCNSNIKALWTMLHNDNLISDEKYRRLTRATSFTEDELAGFIARQLVETHQASKIAADILKRRYAGQTEIVYVKAGNVSEFRQWADEIDHKRGHHERTFDFVKCRDINDMHHAKDAYLNIVVGNAYHVKFTNDPRRFVRENKLGSYSMNRVFDFEITRNGYTAWSPGENGTLATVRSAIRKNNVLFTRYATEAKGQLFDLQLVPRGNGQSPIKTSDSRMTIEKFGGYNKRSGAYFCLVEHTEKKKRVRTLETVFVMHQRLYENSPEEYCAQVLGLKEAKVLIRRIKIDSLISIDGFRMHMSGRSNDTILYKNANQLVVEQKWHAYVKSIKKYIERCSVAGKELELTRYDKINREENIEFFYILLSKLKNRPYSIMLKTLAQKISDGTELFGELSVLEQSKVIVQILNLFRCNSVTADLTLLKGAARTGILKKTKQIKKSDGSSFKLIHQSITGVFEQEIDLFSEDLMPRRAKR